MDFMKTVSPCICETYTRTGKIRKSRGFCKIELFDGRLAIRGVIGPMNNGDCQGAAGQCSDEIRVGVPADGWDREMLDRFCDIWERWHLNDMRPECEHQRKLGWRDISVKKVNVFKYSLDSDGYEKHREAEKAALAALKNGETFTPTPQQIEDYNRPLSLKVYSYDDEVPDPVGYKKDKILGSYRETKKLGFIYPDQFEDGILAKPCPVCGYKYGTKWLHEEIPDDIVEFLKSLPDAPITPAWC